MGTDQETTRFTERSGLPRKRGKAKGIATVALIVVALGFGGYGFLWYRGVNELRQRAESVVSENVFLGARTQQLELLEDAVGAEYDRCQEFIIQREGDFGSFEYCKKFIQWADSNRLPPE